MQQGRKIQHEPGQAHRTQSTSSSASAVVAGGHSLGVPALETADDHARASASKWKDSPAPDRPDDVVRLSTRRTSRGGAGVLFVRGRGTTEGTLASDEAVSGVGEAATDSSAMDEAGDCDSARENSGDGGAETSSVAADADDGNGTAAGVGVVCTSGTGTASATMDTSGTASATIGTPGNPTMMPFGAIATVATPARCAAST